MFMYVNDTSSGSRQAKEVNKTYTGENCQCFHGGEFCQVAEAITKKKRKKKKNKMTKTYCLTNEPYNINKVQLAENCMTLGTSGLCFQGQAMIVANQRVC